MPLNAAAFAKCVNMSGEAYYVLHNGLATYQELDAHLTLEDAITLIEFHKVSEHNKALLEDLNRELSQGQRK